MPEVIVVDGIRSVRIGPRTKMFNLRDDIPRFHDENCGLCGVISIAEGPISSPDAYRYIPGRTRTIYDREK